MDRIIIKLTAPKEGTMTTLLMVVSQKKIHGLILVTATFNITEREKIAVLFNTT